MNGDEGFWSRIAWGLCAFLFMALAVWGLASIFGNFWERLPWWGR